MFDWSLLTHSSIIDNLMLLTPSTCDREITQIEFHYLVKKHIRKFYPVRVSQSWSKIVGNFGTAVGGTYYSDLDEEDQTPIELNFFYNPNRIKFKITKRRFKQIAIVVADTLLHEIIHMRQYRRRNFKSLPQYASTAARTKVREEQEYLGCTDEIDAYGFNIACELVTKFNGNQKSIIKFLNQDLKGLRRKGCWMMYLTAFKHDHNHEIIKRLKKKIIRYLPRAVSGKPFKSCDWICY